MRKNPQLSSNCYKGGDGRHEHSISEQAHTTAPLLLILINKRNIPVPPTPEYNHHVYLGKKDIEPIITFCVLELTILPIKTSLLS